MSDGVGASSSRIGTDRLAIREIHDGEQSDDARRNRHDIANAGQA